MFTLGEKFRVLNTSSDVTLFDGATALTTTALVAAAAKATTFIKIKGFGKFNLADMTDFRGVRAKAAAVEVATHLCVVPTGLAVGNVIEARITLNTERYEGELANNYIVGGRPIVIQTAPLTGITINDIGAAIDAAYVKYKSLFNKSNFVLSTLTNGAGTLTSTIATGYEGVAVSKIEISISAQGAGSYPKTTLVKTVTTAGSQGRGLGKFLEESVRVSTTDNVRAYGMNSPADTTVDLRGSYTQFNWRMTANYDHALGNDSVDFKPTAEHDFTLFLNESTCLDVAAAVGVGTKAINLMASAVIKAGVPVAAASAALAANDAVSTAAYAGIALVTKVDTGVATEILFNV